MARPVTAFDSAVFPNRFTYGLLLVNDEQGRPAWWLDMNNEFYPFGYIHPQVQGARAVVLRNLERTDRAVAFTPEVSRDETRVPLAPETHVMQQFDAELTVDEDGSLDAALTVTLSGVTAAAARAALENVDEDQLGHLIQITLANYFRGATLDEYTIEPRKDFTTPLVARATFTAPRYARKSDRTLRFNQPLFALNMRKTYTRIPERKTPLALFGLPSSRLKITIKLPEGVTPENALEPLALNSPFGSYTYTFTFDEATSTAVIEREFILPIQRVQPDDYAEFGEFCRTIDEHEENELNLLLPEPPEEPEVVEEADSPAVEDEMDVEGPDDMGPDDEDGEEEAPDDVMEDAPALP
jgi:hypothetical protein